MTTQGWLQRRPFIGFCVLAFAWSWGCWLLSPAVKPHAPWLATLLMFAGSVGPSAAAVAVVWTSGGAAGMRAWLRRCLWWKVGWGWMALAFFTPLVIVATAAGLQLALGGAIAPSPAAGHVPMALLNLFAILLLGGPVGEELGWRGYALPRLQESMGWRSASLVMGLVWGAWHLPLFYIAGAVQAQMTLALFLLSVVAMSVIFGWLARHTRGSVPAALVLHTAINFWPTIVPVLPTPEDSRPFVLVVALQVLLAAGLMAAWPISWIGKAAWGSRLVEPRS